MSRSTLCTAFPGRARLAAVTLVCLVIVFVGLVGCGKKHKESEPSARGRIYMRTGTFSIRLPSYHWIRKETGTSKIQLDHDREPAQIFVSARLDPFGGDLTEDTLRSKLASFSCDDCQLGEVQRAQLDGIDGLSADASGTIRVTGVGAYSVERRVRIVAARVGWRTYLLVYVTTPELFDSHLADFEKIVRSFELKKKEPKKPKKPKKRPTS